MQANLNDSFVSQDEQLSVLDMSISELMEADDTSELKHYVKAAKKQLEAMQGRRAKTNIGELSQLPTLNRFRN